MCWSLDFSRSIYSRFNRPVNNNEVLSEALDSGFSSILRVGRIQQLKSHLQKQALGKINRKFSSLQRHMFRALLTLNRTMCIPAPLD